MNTKLDISKFTPCTPGKDWYAEQIDFEIAWNTCERGDWMLLMLLMLL